MHLCVIDTEVEVSFAVDSYRVSESSGSVGVRLRVDGQYCIDFQVEVECRDTDPVSAEGGSGTTTILLCSVSTVALLQSGHACKQQ